MYCTFTVSLVLSVLYVCRCVRRRSCWQKGTSWRHVWVSCGRTSLACRRRCAEMSHWALSRSSLYTTTARCCGPPTPTPGTTLRTNPSLPPSPPPPPPASTSQPARVRPRRNPASTAHLVLWKVSQTLLWGTGQAEIRTAKIPAHTQSQGSTWKNPTRR